MTARQNHNAAQTRASLGLALTAVLLAGCAPATAAPEKIMQGLVISGAAIVDTRTGKLLRGKTIVIADGKIAKIVNSGKAVAAGAAKAIDARGKFIVPGLLEMHAHPMMSPDTKGALTLMLANGITGFRQMAATPELLEMRKQGKLPLSNETPELLTMPGLILTRGNAGSPEAAIAEVQRQKAQGADFIKVVDIPPPAFYAVLKEAKSVGLPVAGHLQATVDVSEVARAGMRSIEHLGPRDSNLLACSTDEAELRRVIALPPAGPPPGAPPPGAAALSERTIATALANPILLTPPGEFLRYQRVIDTFDEAKCRKLADLFAATATWQAPTLIRNRTMQQGADPGYRNDPNLRFMPQSARQMWEELAQQFPSKVSPATAETLKKLFALQMRMVKIFDTAGVKMLAGSDAGGQWIVPGYGLHQEFDLLAEAGLSPLRILQMTTLNGAQFLGREASMGTVEAGKDANLALLGGNPIASVQNLHKIHAVVRAGTYYPPEALADMRKATAERQTAAATPGARP